MALEDFFGWLYDVTDWEWAGDIYDYFFLKRIHS
jgi:hypothetical protein